MQSKYSVGPCVLTGHWHNQDFGFGVSHPTSLIFKSEIEFLILGQQSYPMQCICEQEKLVTGCKQPRSYLYLRGKQLATILYSLIKM